jgi:tetratricopeptide (TPR) repeat protein
MRLTSSYSVFRFDPGEQDLAKPRWLAREGKVEAAEAEYRKVLGQNPDLQAGWLELFDLLRRVGRFQDAAELCDAAARHWGDEAALPHTLRGAALVELGRAQEGLVELQKAIELDDTFFLAWHEYGYAAYRTGHASEALLALDRAFGLEPHTDTLMLRGRILREGGQFDAAEVAFQAATQATDHDLPRREAEREILATRRAAALGGRRPRDFTARERWFVADGGVLLVPDIPGPDGVRAAIGTALGGLLALARDLQWRPAAVAGTFPEDDRLAELLAARLGAIAVGAATLDPADTPLIVTTVADDREEWTKQLERLARWRSGWSFALFRHRGKPGADVVGLGADPVAIDISRVLPEVLARQGLPDEPLPPDVVAIARHPLSAWQYRINDPTPPPGGRLTQS